MTSAPSLAIASTPQQRGSNIAIWAFLVFAVGLLIFIFHDALSLMVTWWSQEEYSHGYMIPLVSAFLIYQRFNQLPAASREGSWLGPLLVLVGLCAFTLGELSAIYTVIQYGFLIALFGLVLCVFGTRGFRLIGVALLYLIFMIPLPSFLYFNLSSQLQLLSSQIGVATIRLFDISVFLEGNVIDLGAMKLQVVEACSGLRYLFPLMSFGFLFACIYRAPFWQRAMLFLSTIPITVLMNSLRIGLIGVSVNYWGIAMAEGFLHDFEGWIVFMACVSILFAEATLLHRVTRTPGRMLDRLQLDFPRITAHWRDFEFDLRRQRPLLVAVALMVVSAPWLLPLNERQETAPARTPFMQFPLLHKHWIGKENALDRDVLGALKLSDYLLADFSETRSVETKSSETNSFETKSSETTTAASVPVNFYIAWYESQKKGASIHSPRSCIPGGGWRMDELAPHTLENVAHVSGKPLVVNRAIIRKDHTQQLVYYWFEGRGRDVTNEYQAKWYIFQDSLLHSRTDGALVRLIAAVPEGSSVEQADRLLERFLRDFYPLLPNYVP